MYRLPSSGVFFCSPHTQSVALDKWINDEQEWPSIRLKGNKRTLELEWNVSFILFRDIFVIVILAHPAAAMPLHVLQDDPFYCF